MSDPYREEKTPLLVEFTRTQEEGLTPVRSLPSLSREELEEMSNKAMDKALVVMQSTAQKVFLQ